MGQYLIGNKRVELDIPQPEAPPPDASAGVDKSDMCLDTTAILFDGADAKPYGISLLSVFDWTGWAEEARRADAPKIDRSVADWKPIPSLINRQ